MTLMEKEPSPDAVSTLSDSTLRQQSNPLTSTQPDTTPTETPSECAITTPPTLAASGTQSITNDVDTSTDGPTEVVAPQHTLPRVIPLQSSILINTQRTAATSTTKRKKVTHKAPPKTAAVPTGDPTWCLSAYTSLRSSLRGPSALQALNRWRDLERHWGYQGITRVSNVLLLLSVILTYFVYRKNQIGSM